MVFRREKNYNAFSTALITLHMQYSTELQTFSTFQNLLQEENKFSLREVATFFETFKLKADKNIQA